MLNGVEAEFRAEAAPGLAEADFLARGSGKLVLLDKLLPRLKEEGHRLLVFSQFKTMLDILEDYFNARGFRHERIDGSITGSRRQQAIDRFQAPASDGKETPFIMMLSTRAGGKRTMPRTEESLIRLNFAFRCWHQPYRGRHMVRYFQVRNLRIFRS